MALEAGEYHAEGYVFNADRELVCVTYDAGEADTYVTVNGTLRDPDGRLVTSSG